MVELILFILSILGYWILAVFLIHFIGRCPKCKSSKYREVGSPRPWIVNGINSGLIFSMYCDDCGHRGTA